MRHKCASLKKTKQICDLAAKPTGKIISYFERADKFLYDDTHHPH